MLRLGSWDFLHDYSAGGEGSLVLQLVLFTKSNERELAPERCGAAVVRLPASPVVRYAVRGPTFVTLIAFR
jgi:hypothetical protein